ncbi:MAG TPA: hypothetical protein VE871_06080 [Longimicrobium sp.]|nr:hypothetical protein [Longimicrobium sp.]
MHLSEFLAAHPADTLLRVIAWQSDGETHVRCVLQASPWWVDPARRLDSDGTLTIDCLGVLESEIRIGWRAGEVEDLEVIDEDHPLLWVHGAHASIYGNAPLPEPDRFFMQLADLVEGSGIGRPVMSVLDTTAEDWRRRVAGPTPYLLLTAPQPIIDACLPFLDAQRADYSVLRPQHCSARATSLPLQLVVIGESWVICQDATVEVVPPLAAAPDRA